MYGNNKSYQGSKTLSQQDYYNFETRLSYNFTPDFWASTDFIYYKGGETSVNGIAQKDGADNFNAGITLAYRIAPTQYVKFIYQKTVSGSQYSPQMQSGFGLTYQIAF